MAKNATSAARRVYDSRIKGFREIRQAPVHRDPSTGLSAGNPLSWDLGTKSEVNLIDPPGVKGNANRAFTQCFRDKVETPKSPALATSL